MDPQIPAVPRHGRDSARAAGRSGARAVATAITIVKRDLPCFAGWQPASSRGPTSGRFGAFLGASKASDPDKRAYEVTP